MGGFTKAPEKDSFYQWYLRQLASDCRWIYLVYEGEDCCGFFYVDKLEDGTYEAASSGVHRTAGWSADAAGRSQEARS